MKLQTGTMQRGTGSKGLKEWGCVIKNKQSHYVSLSTIDLVFISNRSIWNTLAFLILLGAVHHRYCPLHYRFHQAESYINTN